MLIPSFIALIILIGPAVGISLPPPTTPGACSSEEQIRCGTADCYSPATHQCCGNTVVCDKVDMCAAAGTSQSGEKVYTCRITITATTSATMNSNEVTPGDQEVDLSLSQKKGGGGGGGGGHGGGRGGGRSGGGSGVWPGGSRSGASKSFDELAGRVKFWQGGLSATGRGSKT